MATISEKLKKARKKKNISQDKLSKLANVSNTTIIKIESGANKNPTVSTLKKIARALGVTLNDLA